MKVFVDTNIVIDLLSKRKGHYESAAALFSKADRSELEISVSALTIANTQYILSKYGNKADVLNVLRRFKVLVEVAPLDEKIISLALSQDRFTDFEDSLQYYSALETDSLVIITRNTKDFKPSQLPVMQPDEFLAKYYS